MLRAPTSRRRGGRYAVRSHGAHALRRFHTRIRGSCCAMPPTSSPARAPAGGDTPRPAAQRERLPSHVFRLPVQRMRSGYYSDAYFNNAKELLEEDARHTQVLMQVFQKHSAAVLGGIDEAIAVLRECSGSRHADGSWERGWEQLQVRALHEGEEISEREVVLTIEG